jgi:hypothetical protein
VGKIFFVTAGDTLRSESDLQFQSMNDIEVAPETELSGVSRIDVSEVRFEL